jgi:hypothetical protein
MVPEVSQLIWAAMARGEFLSDAAVETGAHPKQGTRWFVPPERLRSRRVSRAQPPGQGVRQG